MQLFSRNLTIILCTLAATLLPVSSSWAGNRFNVFSYQDPWEGTCDHLDTFYIMMDSCGISHLENFNADSFGVYASLIDIKAYTKHWEEREGQELLILPDLSLIDAMIRSANTRMSGENEEIEEGYKKSNDCVAETFEDPELERDILRALYDSGSTAGWLHPEFSQGVFHFIGKHVGSPHEVEYAAVLRLPDTSGSNGSVVAQLVFEYWIADDLYSNCTDMPFRVYRLNDTLLVRNEGGQFVAYPTVDRTPVDTAKMGSISFHSGSSLTSNEQTDLRDFENVCYTSAGTTFCSIPYRYIKDVTDTSFHSPGGYDTISETCVTKNGSWGDEYQYNYKVYWTNVKTVYLDSFFVYDAVGKLFDSLVYSHRSQVVDSIVDWYDSSEALGSIAGFYAFDEPYGPEFQIVERLRKVTDSMPDSTYPQEVMGTLGAYNRTSSTEFAGQYYDTYIHYSLADHFMFDCYHVASYYTSSSYPSDFTNVQCMAETYVDIFEVARERSNLMPDGPVDFWPVFPVHDGWYEFTKGSGYWYKSGRLPTQNELWMLVNLALCYGAKGVGYWPYLSDETENTGRSSTAASDFEPDPMSFYDNPCSFSSDSTNWCSLPSSQCGVYAARPKRKGLAYQDSGNPTPMWDTVRVVNEYLDSMAYFFLSAEVQDVGLATSTGVYSASGIDSVKSQRFPQDSAFLQVAHFEYSNDDYLYILNRRVDDSTIDAQTVDIFTTGEGAYQVWDIYSNVTDTLWDSCGVVRWSKLLPPGKAVLIKMDALKTSWSGSVATFMTCMTWPQFATINVTGDIVVDSNSTLTIETDRLSIPAFSDSESTYTTGKTDIIVKGELRVEGTSADPVEFAPDTSAADSWAGIHVYDGGKLVMDEAVVANAYCGLTLDTLSRDSISNTVFRDCSMYGIKWYSDSSRIEDCTFSITTDSSNGYGVDCTGVDSSSSINGCVFTNIKYPVYLTSSTPGIGSCDFKSYRFYMGGSGGKAAITAIDSSGPSVTNTEIVNYTYGISLSQQSWTNVTTSGFTSDSSYISYGGVDTIPFMYTAIMGHSMGATSCKVRYTCFGRTEYAHINKGATAFNLGRASDTGFNYFNGHKTGGSKPVLIPTYAIYDSGERSVMAEGNCWDIPDTTVKGWVHSAVDTVPSLSVIPFFCFWEEQQAQKTVIPQSEVLPLSFEVSQNYPNPFNPTTTISFTLPNAVHVELVVFNVLGQVVKTLVDDEMGAGTHEIVWDGRSESGKSVSTGVYLYRIKAGEYEVSRKMMLIK